MKKCIQCGVHYNEKDEFGKMNCFEQQTRIDHVSTIGELDEIRRRPFSLVSISNWKSGDHSSIIATIEDRGQLRGSIVVMTANNESANFDLHRQYVEFLQKSMGKMIVIYNDNDTDDSNETSNRTLSLSLKKTPFSELLMSVVDPKIVNLNDCEKFVPFYVVSRLKCRMKHRIDGEN